MILAYEVRLATEKHIITVRVGGGELTDVHEFF
jgi:hypothetical protein